MATSRRSGRELGRVALPTALLQQSLAGNKCYRAGERITELDCQKEEERPVNTRQSKTKMMKKKIKNEKGGACEKREKK